MTVCASDLLQDTLATLHVAVCDVGECNSEPECQEIGQGERAARLTPLTLSLHNSGQVYWHKSDYQMTHDICCSTKQAIHRTVYTLVCRCHLANITTEVTPRTWARMPVFVQLQGHTHKHHGSHRINAQESPPKKTTNVPDRGSIRAEDTRFNTIYRHFLPMPTHTHSNGYLRATSSTGSESFSSHSKAISAPPCSKEKEEEEEAGVRGDAGREAGGNGGGNGVGEDGRGGGGGGTQGQGGRGRGNTNTRTHTCTPNLTHPSTYTQGPDTIPSTRSLNPNP